MEKLADSTQGLINASVSLGVIAFSEMTKQDIMQLFVLGTTATYNLILIYKHIKQKKS